jgi:glycosyltransferase involved in cell wall biosynthesis
VIEDGVTGLLVPPHDPPALAAAIVRLLKDPGGRAGMGEAGLARVKANFSVERMVEGTLSAYRRLIR